MKHFVNNNFVCSLFFALLLSAGWSSQAKAADAVTANFNSGLPEGWSLVGDVTNDDTRYRGNSGKGLWTSSKSATDNYVITEPVEGTFEFYARAYNKNSDSEVIVYEYTGSALGTQLYTTGSLRTSSTPSWSKFSFTVENGTQLALVLNYAAIDDVTYTPYVQVSGYGLTVKDGETTIASGYNYDFGVTTKEATKDFVLSNTGTEDLTVSMSATGGFAVTPTSATIAAGSKETLTVTMAAATASGVVTITPAAGSGLDAVAINVSGTIRDANKMWVDFADGALPDGWKAEASSTYYNWSYSTGYASYNGTSASYSGTLTSPRLTFTAGEKLYFNTAKYSNSTWYSPSVTVETSTDGATWNTAETFTDDEDGVWKTRNIEIASADVKYVRFTGWYFHITNIYGGELPLEAKMKVTAADHDFGMISEEASTTFTIANTGRATLTGITVTSSNSAFIIKDAPASIAADADPVTVTVTMSTTAKGAQSGTITVKATGMDDVTFNVTGYVIDDSKQLITFDDNKLPAGWEATGWTVADKQAYAGTGANNYLVSPILVVEAGDVLAFQVKGNLGAADIKVETSADNGETWNSVYTNSSLSQTEYTTAIVSGIAAGSYKLRFTGFYTYLDNINGFAVDQNAPILALTPAENADFGKVTEQPAAKTYTVENKGTGKMTVNIAASTTDFTVTPAQLKDIENGTPQTFTVTFNYNIENLGAKTADITVTPTYNESVAVTFTATATAKDPNTWAEDFEDGTMPEYWISEGAWTVSTPTATGSNGTKMATISSYNAPKSLTTPRLQASKDDELKFYIGMQYNDEPLTIEYSDDDMATWKVIESGVENYTESGDITFKAPANGQYYVRFTGTFAMLDNFEGFKMALPDHIATITASNIPSYGLKEKVSFDATVTVAESRGVEEQLTAKLYMNGEVIGTETGSVEAKGTKTLTITCTPPAAATDAKMYIEVTYAGGTLKTEEVTRDVAATVKLELTESMTEDITAGTYDVVTVQRTYNQGWNTILLPISVSVSKFGENAKAYAFSGYDAGALKFSSTTTLNPGTPYLLYTPDVVGDLQFTDVTIYESYLTDITVTRDGAVLRGTWLPQDAGTLTGMYGLTGAGKIVQADETISIRGLRAYFELPADAPAPFLMVDGVATGIGAVTESHTNKEGMYNLNGQRVESAGKGVFIVNGKKVVMK